MKNYFVTYASIKVTRARSGKIIKKKGIGQGTVQYDKIKTISDIRIIEEEIKKQEKCNHVAILGITKVKKEKLDTLDMMTEIYEDELKKHLGDDANGKQKQ